MVIEAALALFYLQRAILAEFEADFAHALIVARGWQRRIKVFVLDKEVAALLGEQDFPVNAASAAAALLGDRHHSADGDGVAVVLDMSEIDFQLAFTLSGIAPLMLLGRYGQGREKED